MSITLSGFDEMRRKLRQLQRRASSLSGSVMFEDLFPPEFMRRYTDFHSIDEMIAASGHAVQSQQDLEAIPLSDLDKLVETTTPKDLGCAEGESV